MSCSRTTRMAGPWPAGYQSSWAEPERRPFAGGWRGASDRRWHPVELAGMIVGFVIFWPIGLAILAWKKWLSPRREETGGIPLSLAANTGNSAFEDYKRDELRRLEEERVKLEAAQADFAAFMDRLKRARDREEFERFMAERTAPAQG